jgi:hypothetical protein
MATINGIQEAHLRCSGNNIDVTHHRNLTNKLNEIIAGVNNINARLQRLDQAVTSLGDRVTVLEKTAVGK